MAFDLQAQYCSHCHSNLISVSDKLFNPEARCWNYRFKCGECQRHTRRSYDPLASIMVDASTLRIDEYHEAIADGLADPSLRIFG